MEFFDRLLAEAWEIYIQPHLNGLRPDFVLLNPEVGIAVFEVKDWCLPHSDEVRGFRRRENPLAKVRLYKQAILEVYCPRIRSRANYSSDVAAVVTAGVILSSMTTEEAVRLLDPSRIGRAPCSADSYYPIAGGDALDINNIDLVFPTARRHKSWFINEELADDLRTWLKEPDFSLTQRQPLLLDEEQRKLVVSRTTTQSGYRRIKGPAGSGKSATLAARTSWLSAHAKEVLVVTFNMTLWHCLRDLAVRYPEPGRCMVKNVVWDHFHHWCKRVIYLEADMQDEYGEMWAEYFRRINQRPGDTDALLARQGERSKELAYVMDVELPALATEAIDRASATGNLRMYDAVLVDEGQDFLGSWWNVLRKVVRPDGEMWLVADDTQDLYGRSTSWTDAPMAGSGFTGRWAQLEGSYRLPMKLIPLLERFVSTFLEEGDPPSLSHTQIMIKSIEPMKATWWQIDATDDVVATCVAAVLQMPCFADPVSVSFTDVTLLVGDNETGLESVRLLGERGINVAHTFGENYWEKLDRKLGFYMGDGRVKATTIHSFKGWETRALVLHIPRANSQQALKAAYAGLTRLKAHPEGSFLTVICTAPELEKFGELLMQSQDS